MEEKTLCTQDKKSYATKIHGHEILESVFDQAQDGGVKSWNR